MTKELKFPVIDKRDIYTMDAVVGARGGRGAITNNRGSPTAPNQLYYVPVDPDKGLNRKQRRAKYSKRKKQR